MAEAAFSSSFPPNPVVPSTIRADGVGAPRRRRGADASVLVVDDIEANLVALEAVLQPLGCSVVRGSSGQEALKVLLERDVAVLLLDVMMPELDGLTTAGLIKNRSVTRH